MGVGSSSPKVVRDNNVSERKRCSIAQDTASSDAPHPIHIQQALVESARSAQVGIGYQQRIVIWTNSDMTLAPTRPEEKHRCLILASRSSL
jgi:hypothetical protein